MKKRYAALIFLVPFSIVISIIGVNLWWGSYMSHIPLKFEQVKFEGTDVLQDATGNGYLLVMNLTNIGNSRGMARNDSVLFDGKLSIEYTADTPIYFFSNTTILPGGKSTLYVSLPKGNTWASGTNVDIAVQTEAGRLYTTTVALP